MKKRLIALSVLTALTLSACTGNTTAQSDSAVLSAAQTAYLEKVDEAYAYDLAVKMEEIKSNPALGYRTAGSQAEIATGDMLKAEMEKIGLSDVTKDPFTLDTWTFEKAELTFTTADGTEKTVQMGGYQTNFNTQGQEEFSVVYGGEGTPDDLEGLDVEGKLILIDINQRDNWWINYPAYEAYLHGAAGILAAQDGGYGEVSPDALNAQDVCGRADAPAFSISRTDADLLKAALETEEDGTGEVLLDAQSTVEENGTTYNITGVIPGKDAEKMVLMSAHYDSYFAGFQDDNAAIALMMGIAKAMVESGYQPEKTLVFCAMAAEEWGATNTRYDWSTGAYNQIFNVHPEWAGKVVANINFELPAMNEGETDQIRSAYELKTFNEAFAPKVPVVEGVFPKGIEVIVPTQTWSDDFSLSIAGVPANVTALRDDFARTHYHSQFDNRETYSGEAMRFHLNMYGLLMMEYDHCAVSPLDFTTRLEEMSVTLNPDVMALAGVDTATLTEALTEGQAAAATAYEKVAQVNADYAVALAEGKEKDAEAILAESQGLYSQVLDTFKFAQDTLVRLTWEDVAIFPHEHSQNNLAAIEGALTALKDGDAVTALDEYLYLVDNNWYAYDWSRDTFDYFTDYVMEQPAERLFWGAGRVQGHEDLYDTIQSLLAKAEAGDTDFATEIAVLEAAKANQITLLEQQVAAETAALTELGMQLSEIK